MNDTNESCCASSIVIGRQSPSSPLPTPTSSAERYYTAEESDPVRRREIDWSNGSPIRLSGQQQVPIDDLLTEAIWLSVDSEASTPDVGQNREKSTESVRISYKRPLHRVRSLDTILEQGSRERVTGDVCSLEQQQDACEAPDSEWEEGQAEEENPERRLRGEPQACLFVASLAASRTDIQLVDSVTEHFKKWGRLLNVKVLKDWMNRPYSFVQFEHIEDAQKAMAGAQNTIIDGRHIRIEQARVNRTLFILRFGRTATEQNLLEVLEQYGRVEDVSIFNDLGPARNRRYAFAKFMYRDDAIRAYISLRSNSKWTVEWAPNLSDQNQIDKESIFVGQLNAELATETALHERFQGYGGIRHVHLVKRNKPGASRSTAFAFIEFDDEQSARRAIELENNTQFLGTTIRVQHREASEYRQQRQNAAVQAARNLDMSHVISPTQIGMPTPPVHTQEFSGGYQAYRGPDFGRSPMYYATYYTYPATNMPVTSPGFITRPPLGATYVQPGSVPRGTTMAHDACPEYYHGAIRYSGQVNQPVRSIASAFRERYDSTQTVSGQQGYDYTTYIQTPEGIYIPHAVPTRVYMYDQAPAIPAVAQGSPVPAPVAATAQSTLAAPPLNSLWYNSSGPAGTTNKGAGPEPSNPYTYYTFQSQARLSDAGSSPVDLQGQPRKST